MTQRASSERAPVASVAAGLMPPPLYSTAKVSYFLVLAMATLPQRYPSDFILQRRQTSIGSAMHSPSSLDDAVPAEHGYQHRQRSLGI